MKKTTRLLMRMLVFSLVALMTFGFSAGAVAQASAGTGNNQLVIFTWADYLPQELLDAFETETGIKVVYTYFTSNDEMLTKLQAAGGGTYDLVLASDYIIDIARKEGLLQELNKNLIPRFGDIDPRFQGQFYDEENKYTVPFAAGTPLIVYNPDMVTCEITGYDSWWDSSLKNSLVLIDDARVMLGMTLKTMGYGLNETDPEVIRAAGEKFKKLQPNILAYDYDTPHEKLISGDAAVGFMFTPQAFWAISENPNLVVVYPEEGMGFGIDSFFIPSKAPNADAANLFLDFILDGETSADLSLWTQYMNCVSTAKEFLPEEYYNEVLYIPADVLGETEFIQDVGADASEVYAEVWVSAKQAVDVQPADSGEKAPVSTATIIFIIAAVAVVAVVAFLLLSKKKKSGGK